MIVYPFELPFGRPDALLYYRPVRGHEPLTGTPFATVTVLNPAGAMVLNHEPMSWNATLRRFEVPLDLSDALSWPKAMGYRAVIDVVTETRGFSRPFSFSVCAEVWEPNLTFDDLVALSSESAFVREADASVWPRLLTEAAQDVYLRLRERVDRPALLLGPIRDELDRAHKWKTLELFYLRQAPRASGGPWEKAKLYAARFERTLARALSKAASDVSEDGFPDGRKNLNIVRLSP